MIDSPFNHLYEEQTEISPFVKERLMRNIDYVQFVLDVADLFSVKYLETIKGMFLTDQNQNLEE